MSDFYYCPNCGSHGPEDELETGLPEGLFDEENIPGGGDLDYHAHTAECCPTCNHAAKHVDEEELDEWLNDISM